MLDWIQAYEDWFAPLIVISLVCFLGSVILVPWIIVSLPVDYFTRELSPIQRLGIGRVLLHIAKNVVGAFFIIIGFLMLILPGQGILTLLLGFSMIDFPAKRPIQVRILKRPRVRKAVDWIRIKGQRAPLEFPNDSV